MCGWFTHQQKLTGTEHEDSSIAPSYMEDDFGTINSLITLKAINNNEQALMKCVIIRHTIQFKGHLQKKATVNYESLKLTML